AALTDLLDWFKDGGEVGIYDATNVERSRRDRLHEACTATGIGVLFVEIICNDPAIIEANVRKNKLNLPDYDGMSPDEALPDFHARIAHYARSYRQVGDDEGSYVKVIDAGRKVITSGIEGYLSSRLAFFLMQIRPTERTIWLTRH